MIAKLLGMRMFDIEASSRCNLSCQFCSRHLLPETGLMRRETFERFLDHTPLTARDGLSFVGIGEPLLNPLLPEFIREAKARCRRVRTWVTTNGQLLTPKTLQSLLDAGLDTLDVSVNGTDAETYETLMKGGRFERVVTNLEHASGEIGRRGNRMQLQVNFIVTDENHAREAAIKAFWRTHGVERFRLQRMHNRGGTVDVEGMSDVEGAGLKGRGCSLFETMSFVSWKGEVFHCSHDVRRQHPIGDINTDSWTDIRDRKLAIQKGRCWPEMCQACTDPLRHDLGVQIGKQIMTELGEAAARGLGFVLGRSRQWRPAAAVSLSDAPDSAGGA